MSIKSSAAFFIKFAIVGLALAFVVVLVHPDLLQREQNIESEHSPTPLPRSQGPASYADAVDRALPSVVNIYIAKVRIKKEGRPLFSDPLLQHLFGNRYLIEPKKRIETSLGSGVIIDRNGYILTNDHVIKGASRIQVALPGGRSFEAKVIGTDPDTDLAVLKADANNLPAIPVGDPEKLRIGDVTLAIGNPFGVGQTVTMGIISATGRSQLGINTYENFIQTDAAINPGNSGGALINAHGELIGINTVIFSKSGGSQGIGFAIPVDLAMNVQQQIQRHGRVVRGWMGVSGQNMTRELAKAFNLKSVKGVLITGVMRDGPADRAGLLPGDILTRLDDQELRDTASMMRYIANIPPGIKTIAKGWRGEHKLEIPVIMMERPKTP